MTLLLKSKLFRDFPCHIDPPTQASVGILHTHTHTPNIRKTYTPFPQKGNQKQVKEEGHLKMEPQKVEIGVQAPYKKIGGNMRLPVPAVRGF